MLCVTVLVAGGIAAHATWTLYDPERELTFSVYPWPFGIVIAADEAALDPGKVIGTLAAAVEFAFELWALPVPTVPENWNEVLDDVICDYGFRGRSYTERIWGLGERWSRCLLEHGDVLLWPLAVVIYPSFEDLAETHRLWSRSAFFGEVDLKLYPALPTPNWTYSPGVALTADHFTSGGGIVVHEITHWLQYASQEVRMLPRILREGMAELTAARWTESEDYRTMSAAFAETNDLSEVPPMFHYSAGASLFETIWASRGPFFYSDALIVESSCEGEVRSCEVWDDYILDFEEDWRERLASIEVSDVDRVHREATAQWLRLVGAMLDPVLTTEARATLARIRSDEATFADIEAFWNSVEVVPFRPSEIAWDALDRRVETLRYVACENAQRAAPPCPYPSWACSDHYLERKKLASELRDFRAEEDWPGYFARYLELVRDIIAEGAVYPQLVPWWSEENGEP